MFKKAFRINFVRALLRLHARYLSNLSATFISQAISALSILALTPRLLQVLGTEQFSIYGVILNLILFSAVFDFGLNTGLLRRLIHREQDSTLLINSVFFFFCCIFLFSIPLYFFLFKSGFVKAGGQPFWISLFVALIISQNILATLFDAIIQSVNRIYVSKIIRILRTLLEFLVLFILSKTGKLLYLLVATATINFLYLLSLYLYSQKIVRYRVSLNNFRWAVLKNHLRYSFWYFQNMTASVLVYNAQIILISHLTTSINVAKYLVVARFFEIIGTGLNNFTLVLFPALSKLQADGNWIKLRLMYMRVLLRVSVFTCFAMILVISFGKQFFVLWSKYNDPITIQLFQLYSFFIALMIIENVPNLFIMALKINKWPSIMSTIQGLLGLLFCYILIPRLGIAGSIFASLTAFLLTNCFFNPIYLWIQINRNIRRGSTNLSCS